MRPQREVAQLGRNVSPIASLSSANFTADMFVGSGTSQPGIYELDVKVNGQWVQRRSIELRTDQQGHLQPCLSLANLQEWGLDTMRLEAARVDGTIQAQSIPAEGSFCQDLRTFIPEASVIADTAQLNLQVTFPQLYVLRQARDWVDPAHWDDGVTAATVRYNLNAYRNEYGDQSRQSASMGLNAGLNVGPWRLRHDGYLRWSEGLGNSYDASNTYLQRDIRPLGAQLLLGQSYSRGDLFSSVGFTGAQIYSDERMLPSSQRGFAPTVRGVANGNSTVSIYQQGRLIHEVSVANGPFEISDLYPTSYGGDLEIVITAANGSAQRFMQTYASVPQLLRPGQNRFSLTAGRVRSWDGVDEPYLVEGTWRRGINNALTGYAGMRSSEGYLATVLGAAINLRIGALAADVTASRADNPSGGAELQGQSYRLTYSKELVPRKTNVSLAAYRYSTAHYRELSDHIRDGQRVGDVGFGSYYNYRQRSRFNISLSQRLSDGWGTLWLGGNMSTYWDGRRDQTTYNLGYSNQWRRLSIGATIQRSQISTGIETRNDTQYGLTLSLPLGDAGYRSPRLSTAVNQSDYGTSLRAGISASPTQAFSYGVGLGRDERARASADANVAYNSRYAGFNGYYSRSDDSQSLSLGMQGGLVVHGGGVTLAPNLGDTVALVSAAGAAGARINGDVTRVDRRGYAVVGSVSPYRMNTIQIDPSGIDDRIQILSSNSGVAPTLGAVVPVVFRTQRSGATRLAYGKDSAGRLLSFGAEISDPEGQMVGMVGQGGQMWLAFNQEQTAYVLVKDQDRVLRCELTGELQELTCVTGK
ncbi:fimbria/pilus outer membrane usher protein [Stenotrophomonas sp. B1-1]|uniref:fimbria/pilus outer membrane usher protein n=1 Tax=Stenotrophomonas sp. B1-1 TaxID=2710648 RepID=UPI0013DD4493|nr:fimbria/pilus outer membrane usher protein [Stenotrophomonas sp. B1-1]